MTNDEFSDVFTTLLNSYNTQANFGKQASDREIVLDEYEKSVLLTQAQDLIVKSYFDGTLNSQGQGFDDSIRRQVDFSSLIKVADLTPDNNHTEGRFDQRGLLFKMPTKTDGQSTDVLFILNEKLIVSGTGSGYWKKGNISYSGAYNDAVAKTLPHGDEDAYTSISDAENDGWSYVVTSAKEYVIVPINYKEYDREMSKPYAQPLKKQAWRLFQNKDNQFSVYTELIPKHLIDTSSISNIIYRIRYVRRPQPIVLENMPNGLTVDGTSVATPCELNPILHMDILNKAVELAITTRGGGTAVAAPRNEDRRD